MGKDKKKSNRVKPRLLKGMQDGWPELANARRHAIARIEEVCQRFGFLPFDTPALETVEALLGPDPSDAAREGIFHFVNADGEDVGLRYEHTGPLARVVSQYEMELTRPFRRYTTGPVWRFDKPEPGRFREFLQFDVDTIGSSSMAADAEVIAVIHGIMEALELDGYVIRISNRKLLNALGDRVGATPEQGRDIYRVIDKLDKFDRQRIRLELGPGLVDQSGDPIPGLDLSDKQIALIDEFLDLPDDSNESALKAAREWFGDNALAVEGIDELEQLMEYAKAYGVPDDVARIDLRLARGLGYYSGPVFEVVLTAIPGFGSMFGGGRYDGLVERFRGAGQGIPAVGASAGVDRLLAAVRELGLLEDQRATSKVLVTVMDKARMADYIAITRELREGGVPAETYLGGGNLGKQLKYADRWGIPLAVIAGEDEFEKGELSVKDLELGRRLSEEAESREEWQENKQQFTIKRDELVAKLRGRY